MICNTNPSTNLLNIHSFHEILQNIYNFLNKAYRSNAHLLDNEMHYNGNII